MIPARHKGLAIALTVLTGTAISLFALERWATWSHQHPTDRDVERHVQSLTDITLPDDSHIISARRSPSSWMGDHRGCFLIEISEEAWSAFLSQIEQTEEPSFDSGCPDPDNFERTGGWEFQTSMEPDIDTLVLVYVDPSLNRLLLKYYMF
jgi:hypothetical protein